MIIAEVCLQYGWTYEEYLDQPIWFIDLIVRRMEIDAKKQKAENQKLRARKR